MAGKEDLLPIFRLKRDISEIYFKAFFHIYDFKEGMNPTLMQTLIYLEYLGSSSMTRISNILQLEKGSFTPVARRLVDMGYVVKSRNQKDKRIFELTLTVSGESLVRECKDKHWEYIHNSLSVLSGKEQKEYFTLIEKLNRINGKLRKELEIKGIFD